MSEGRQKSTPTGASDAQPDRRIELRYDPGPVVRPPRLVSVVIPCRNVEASLPEQLAALNVQDYRAEFEVLIVDNRSTDGTPAMAKLAASASDRIRVVAANERLGINHARNQGVASSCGDFVAFCDGDDRVRPGWLTALVRGAATADVVGGRIDWSRINSPSVVALWGSPPRVPVVLGAEFLYGGNFGCWKSVWDSLGGFDETFRYGGTEIDFCVRAREAGFRLDVCDDAVIDVRLRDTYGSMLKREFRIGRGRATLAAKHPHLDGGAGLGQLRRSGRVVLGNLKRRRFRSADLRRALLAFARDTGQYVERQRAHLEHLIARRAARD